MFNISENTQIIGLKESGCKRSHIQQCLSDKTKRERPDFSYWGKTVSRGTVRLHTCKGDYDLVFAEKNGWATYAELKKPQSKD